MDINVVATLIVIIILAVAVVIIAWLKRRIK